nr:WD repeat-containing protein 89 homolog [Tanacetum cinerariifolium]
MDFSEESVEKRWGKESANKSGLKFISCFDSSFVEFVQPCFCFSNSEKFVNVFMRVGFGSTIKLVSFDKGQVVTFNGKFVCGFRNSDCETESRNDNTVISPHGFIIHWIIISKNIKKKVTEIIYVENWRRYSRLGTCLQVRPSWSACEKFDFLKHATGNSENVAIWKSTSDRRGRSVSRGTEDWSTMAVSLSSNTMKLYSPVTGQFVEECCKGEHSNSFNEISLSGNVLYSCSSTRIASTRSRVCNRPFSWGPAVGGEGACTRLTLRNVEISRPLFGYTLEDETGLPIKAMWIAHVSSVAAAVD